MTTNTQDTASHEVIEAASLEIEDIKNAIRHIDIGANEGAYKSWKTIIEVWNNRSRLVRFVEYAEAARAAEDAAKAEAATEQPE